ncbi:MAG TPA: protein kinase, partial [Thermoanaerobaculia bacterium]|nr:protein kinase [Thermoanaerobaculia bacterium]
MTLSAGTKLGPYEILSPLGAGGMGEVYRARDTRLGRDVALKVLPERLAQDPEMLARFEREAQAVAALSHPNILGLFDVGKEGATVYAVMELLEGSTLRDRLTNGPLPFRKCVDYGIQLAEGLAAAHDKGIVHRDLKPENVFVTSEGRVKILDFGLAKSVAIASAGADTNSPTAAPTTDAGTVLGTVGYMSPEQVRGRTADARSDIFSFGAVAYEMSTGSRPFSGASAVETMNAVLRDDPPEISTIRSVPPEYDRIVRHCLEKEREERFQSARDIVFALKSLDGGSSSRVGTVGRVRAPRRWAAPALAVAALVAAAAAFRIGRVSGERAARANPPSFQRLTFRRGTIFNARFASDGKTIVYCAAWQGEDPSLFTVRATGPDSQKLDLPPAMLYSVSKSDELAIGLGWRFTTGFTSEATLARATLSGGAPRPIAERVVSADWAPDGENLAISRYVGASDVLEYPIGRALHSTVGWMDQVRVSPDGGRVCFAEHRFRGDTAGDLVVVDRNGRATTLVRDLTVLDGLSWISDGREILWSGARSGNSASLWAVDLSGRERFLHRSGITEYAHDASAGGAALVIQSTARRETYLSGPAAGGARDRDLSWLDWTFPDAISADGGRILSTEQGDASREEYLVYLRKTDGSAAVQLGPGNALAMSPDGRLVAANRRGHAGGRRVLVLYPTGAGQSRTIDMPNLDPLSATFFPDSRRLVVCADAPGRPTALYEVSLEGGPVRPIPGPLMNPFFFFVSPDAESVAGVTSDGRIVVIPVRGGVPRLYPAELGAASVAGWSADGRSCYYSDRGTTSARIYRLELATGRHELVREIAVQD